MEEATSTYKNKNPLETNSYALTVANTTTSMIKDDFIFVILCYLA